MALCVSKMADQAPKYLGDFSAAPPWFSILMECHDCNVSWTGCWDNFECPKCGHGELPSAELAVSP